MSSAQPLIAGISQTAALPTQPQAALLKQSKVMHPACIKSRGQNASTALLNHHLSLQGVPLLPGAEESFAFFAPLPCGCSTGHSLASITTCDTMSEERKAFSPVNEIGLKASMHLPLYSRCVRRWLRWPHMCWRYGKACGIPANTSRSAAVSHTKAVWVVVQSCGCVQLMH